ncbi:hypothetical protein, partial [Bacillus sp. TH008]|uniref:hypothetical protein n=1 Tax=Bacillus sp. TH008 TaxID=1609979 RepID=UPI001F1AAF2B
WGFPPVRVGRRQATRKASLVKLAFFDVEKKSLAKLRNEFQRCQNILALSAEIFKIHSTYNLE